MVLISICYLVLNVRYMLVAQIPRKDELQGSCAAVFEIASAWRRRPSSRPGHTKQRIATRQRIAPLWLKKGLRGALPGCSAVPPPVTQPPSPGRPPALAAVRVDPALPGLFDCASLALWELPDVAARAAAGCRAARPGPLGARSGARRRPGTAVCGRLRAA